MPQLDATHVQVNDCTVVWDAITRPEVNDGGNTRWGLKVVIHPNNPDLALIQQLANSELQNSEFKGVLPNGGIMPICTAAATEFNGLFTGFAVVNASTFKMPNVHEEGGAIMQPMQYGNLLYSGQSVNIIVNASAYNNKSKGVALRLDGFQINASRNAERLAFGGGGYDTSAAFGAGAAQQPANNGQQGGGFQQNAAPQQGGGFQQNAAPQQGGGFQQNAAPQQGGGFQQNAAPQQGGGFQQNAAPQQGGGFQQNAAPQQGGGFQQNAAPQQGGGFQQNAAPQQSTNFLPGQQ